MLRPRGELHQHGTTQHESTRQPALGWVALKRLVTLWLMPAQAAHLRARTQMRASALKQAWQMPTAMPMPLQLRAVG